MFAPARLWFALRHRPDAALIAGAISVAVLFSATPFILRPVAEEFGVSLGTSALLSSAQVGGFAITAFFAGRTLRTDRRFLVAAAFTATAVNVLSVFISSFWILLVARIVVGSAAGLITWLAWANAMRTSGLRNVAAVGPLSVLVAVPILAALADSIGTGGVFLAMAVVSLPPALLPVRFEGFRPPRTRMSPARSNVILLVALGAITLAGSALFVFGATIGRDKLGMDPTVVSIGYSLNAFAGLVAARRHASYRLRGIWVMGVGLSAAAVAFGTHPLVFLAGLTAWGFFFWMATPNILLAIGAWSLVPDERIGDAQSVMAVGRALGPAIAAVLVADGAFGAVGTFSVVGLVVSGVVVEAVRRYRETHEPPAGVGRPASIEPDQA